MAIGTAGSVVAVSGWRMVGSANLDSDHTLRVVMPAVFSLALGVQIVCSSFFLSILGMRRR